MKNTHIKTTVLFVIAVFCVGSSVTPLFGQPQELKILKQLETKETQVTETIKRPKVDYTADNLRDPFQGVVVEEEGKTVSSTTGKEVPLPSLAVQGVIWGSKTPQAIINRKVVKAGDTVEGVKIISIEKDSITAFYEGRQFKIPSPASASPAIKKPQGG